MNKIEKVWKVSKETRDKMSVAQKGRNIWTKGSHHDTSPETRKKISDTLKGHKGFWLGKKRGPLSEEQKGKLRRVNIGKKYPVETRMRVSKVAKEKGFGLWMKGRKLSEETRRKQAESRKGEKSNFWKGGITPEIVKIRTGIEMRLWREAVFARDNWTCQECNATGYLNAHHIKQFAKFPELRFAIDNGITLCVECHKKYRGEQ